MVIPALIIIVIGALIAVGPWTFAPVCEVPTDENPDGLWVVTKANKTLPMPCGYTARAEIGVGTGIALVGGMLFFATSAATITALGAATIILGGLTLALPNLLTKMCAMQSHPCNLLTLPVLNVLGVSLVIIAVGMIVYRKKLAKQ